ncbi:MAG: hypothetical protein ABII81_09685 [Pseudomonadota bacterium]
MLVEQKSICIISSTLPFGLMVSAFDSLKISKIIVLSKSLEHSCQSFKNKYPSVEVVRAPSGFVNQQIYFVLQLINAKLGNTKVIIFHECCMPLLDLLLAMVKPDGYYFPQVTMSGQEEVDFDQIPKSKLTICLKFFGLDSYFKVYRDRPIGGKEPEYALSIKKYPQSIITKDVQYSRELKSRYYSSTHRKTKKILFITGKSYVSDLVQIKTYKAMIKEALSRGYVCEIKDHPNPYYRLNLSFDNVVEIDPFVPVELLERDYCWVVAVSSTSLLSFGATSISLVDLFVEMSTDDRSSIKNHFNCADPENKIKYLKSIEEFKNLL